MEKAHENRDLWLDPCKSRLCRWFLSRSGVNHHSRPPASHHTGLVILHGFTFSFESQRSHHLHEVAKSFVDLVESRLKVFKSSFVIDGSFSTRTIISHEIEVKILTLIPILVQWKVCFETKQKNTQEQT